jgi:hypothetical protein
MNIKHMLVVLVAAFPLVAQAAEPAGKAVLITGSVTAATADGTRSLGNGAPVYVGDTLTVGPNSYANLLFNDGGRILLRPNSEFTIEAFQRVATEEAPAAAPRPGAKAAASPDRAVFRLARGGFRAISGLIRGTTENYRVATPSATIGIRGTDYEVQTCTDDCPQPGGTTAGLGPVMVASSETAGLQLAQAGGGGNGGVVVATNDGLVVLQTGKGEFLVKVGEVAFAMFDGQVFMLPSVPDLLLYYSTPSPEDCQ